MNKMYRDDRQEVTDYFKTMYYYIWQGHDLSKLDEFYARDFVETISAADHQGQPLEILLNYDELAKQARWQKENYQDTSFDIKKIVVNENQHVSMYFYSTSRLKKNLELQHRSVCGIWRLNTDQKIDRVWAVVTPFYAEV